MSDENICPNENNCPKDRRRPLTEGELNAIKDQLLESIYADIGESIVKKILWVFGAICIATYSWLKAEGKI